MRPIDFNKLIFWTPMIILLAFFAFAIIKLTIASPAVPNPGHSYSEVEFPSGIVFTPAGQLGIGATTPSSLLHINRSSDAIADISLSRSGSGNIWGLYRYGSSGSDRFCIGIFGTNEPFCITTAGSVGIGTTNPGNYKLNVIGDINASWVNVTRGIGYPDGSTQTTAGGSGGGGLAIFGDGSDGPGVVSAITFLSKDMFYSSLTINLGATLNTNGYRIFVRGTLTNNGVITRSGNSGQNGNFGAGASGGAALSNASLGGSGAGGYAQLLSANNGEVMLNSLGGSGGSGGGGTVSFGGAGGLASAPAASQGGYRSLPSALILRQISSPWAFVAGGGGGGGGGSSAVAGPTYVSGGGGGSGGGVMIIAANVLVNNGAIQANGGAGGNAYAGGNPGGGGGGGGGVIVLIYNSYSGTGTKTVSGGAGGTGFGTGTNGNAGSAGTLIDIPNA